MTHYQQALAHLVRMARMPGAIDQARHRCRELEQTEMFKGIAADVARELKADTQKPQSKATATGSATAK